MSVSFDYSGKLVLVTGSTKGIGRTIAEHFIKSGASVVINGRSQETVDAAVAELTKLIAPAADDAKQEDKQVLSGCAADLSTEDGCTKLVEFVGKIGHLDVLINNTGKFTIKDFVDITDAEWMDIFNVNVMSTVRMCRAFLPKMLENAKGGKIVNISSEAGVRSLPHMLHYSVTKAAQLNISRGLAELTKGKDNDVRVNALLPGPTWTPGVEQFIKDWAAERDLGDDLEKATEAFFKEFEPDSIKQKFLSTTEIAEATLWLTSDAASGINGSAFKVEGGIIKIAF